MRSRDPEASEAISKSSCREVWSYKYEPLLSKSFLLLTEWLFPMQFFTLTTLRVSTSSTWIFAQECPNHCFKAVPSNFPLPISLLSFSGSSLPYKIIFTSDSLEKKSWRHTWALVSNYDKMIFPLSCDPFWWATLPNFTSLWSPSSLSVTGLGAPLSSSHLKRRYISLQNEWMNERMNEWMIDWKCQDWTCQDVPES